MKLGLPTAEQFLQKPEAISAGQRLSQSFPAGSTDPAVVMTTVPGRAGTAVKDLEGVDQVRPAGSGGGWTELDVVLEDGPDSQGARDTVERMRDALDDVSGRSYVGGTTAEAIDLQASSTRDRWVIFPVILLLVLGALLLLLRSVVAPVLLVATVLGTYAAALGASWWLFTGVLGFSGLDEGMPLLAFLFLVALGVDYNIFLVTRTWEETAGHGSRDGMLRALAATGGVITSAGILLAAVFAVLGRAAARRARPARRGHLRRGAPRHPGRPHGPGARARTPPRRPVLVAASSPAPRRHPDGRAGARGRQR